MLKMVTKTLCVYHVRFEYLMQSLSTAILETSNNRSEVCPLLNTSTSTYGPRSFAVSGPSVWNKLPATLHVSPTLGQFQSKLKAVLFRSAYET